MDSATLLLETLSRLGPSKASDIAKALQVSQPTVSRMIMAARGGVVRAGGSKNTMYAASRQIRQLPDEAVTVFRISEDGQASVLGKLRGVRPEGYLASFSREIWPLEYKGKSYFYSIPYSIHDARPQGFMGRAFARRHGDTLGINKNPEKWTDDQILVAMVMLGDDLPGDMIVGEQAYRRFEEREHEVIGEGSLLERYFALAEDEAGIGAAGSSAAGEFPKFTAVRDLAGQAEHVIVKFSGKGGSPAERRWGDLLRCESHAADVAEVMDVPAAKNRAMQHSGRTFMETTRFDRVGLSGRRGVCSLGSLDAELIGMGDPDWDRFAERLLEMRLIDSSAVGTIKRIWFFGKLIANSDMHSGNLSFSPRDNGKLGICPMYDMLPMRYAPLRGGEVPEIELPRLYRPLPGNEEDYEQARHAAEEFWVRVSQDPFISDGFRNIACQHLAQLTQAESRPGRSI